MPDANDHLREVLLDRIHEFSDAHVARAYNRAYEGSDLAVSTVQRFRVMQPPEGTAPSILIQKAVAVSSGTTLAENWDEAIERWRGRAYHVNAAG